MRMMERLPYLARMSIAGGALCTFLAAIFLSVSHIAIIITLPLAVLIFSCYTKSQNCKHCGKCVFDQGSGLNRYIWGILYFPFKCPHCQKNLCSLKK